MLVRILADATLILHLSFIVFVVLGGLLVLCYTSWMWLHVPALAWGIAVEILQLECPLTALENRLRHQAGEEGYQAGFIEHYVLPIIYPPGLDADTQWLLGIGLLLVNLVLYGVWLYRKLR